MCKVVDGFTVYTFDEWKELPEVKEIAEQIEDKSEKCSECNGEGDHECECGHRHECGFCDGKGTTGIGTLKDLYEEELSKELKKMLEWKRVTILESAK